MSSAEFAEHIAMASLEPALYYPEMLFGKVCATIANALSRRRGRKAFTAADFFSLDHDKPEQSEEHMVALLEQLSEDRPRGAVIRKRK